MVYYNRTLDFPVGIAQKVVDEQRVLSHFYFKEVIHGLTKEVTNQFDCPQHREISKDSAENVYEEKRARQQISRQ